MKRQNITGRQSNSKQKGKAETITLPYFKLYCGVIVKKIIAPKNDSLPDEM